MRYPESGPVAFQLHLPDIWTAKVGNSGSMLVIEPDGSAAISLTLMHENEVTLAGEDAGRVGQYAALRRQG